LALTDDIAALVASADSLDAGIARALDAILAATGTTSGTVHLLEASGSEMRLVVAKEIPPPVIEKIRRIPVGKGMAGVAVEKRQPVTTCNLQQDDAGGVIRQGARATGVQGALALPLLVRSDGGSAGGERAIGALGVATKEPRDFSREEIDRLLDIGRAVARAVGARSR
jgi:GAF domain-containing protein